MQSNPSQFVTLKLIGTSPLSFETKVGDRLVIRRFLPSSKIRPSISGSFKKVAYIVFNGITKIGQIDKRDQPYFENKNQIYCRVCEIDITKKIIYIQIKN